LGSSGIAVGAVGLGCMPMNWAYTGETSEPESIAVIRRALDLGATLLDTSDVYGPFTNEELIGRALDGRRGRAVIATKTGLVVGPDGFYPLQNDARPEHIRASVDGSLRRLRTDVIDLYQLHRIDPAVPLEESWGAMAEGVTAGKVRALGMSEASIEEMERAGRVHPVATVQSELSIWFRDRLDDVVPWCAANGVTFIPFSPLGRGYLTGTITSPTTDRRDFRSMLPRYTQASIDENRGIVEGIRTVAERHHATPAQIARNAFPGRFGTITWRLRSTMVRMMWATACRASPLSSVSARSAIRSALSRKAAVSQAAKASASFPMDSASPHPRARSLRAARSYRRSR
jgi:aryl-alcohol dehydrogenase-like predicted oxidoreductase